MPREWTVTVADWPELGDKHYRCRIRSVDKQRKPPGLCITIEHLEREQRGRQHECMLPLPCRPDGPTAAFFRACGSTVAVGRSLRPKQCVGCELLVRFGRTQAGLEPVEFAAVSTPSYTTTSKKEP